MTWEKRGKSKYYYRKIRIGKKVRSIYMGNSITGLTPEIEDLEKRISKEKEKNNKLHACQERDKKLDEMIHHVDLFVNSLFLLSGYHCHKGEWRKPHERNHRTPR
jgi:hypothetical protein